MIIKLIQFSIKKNKIKHIQAIQAMQPCKNYVEGDLGKLK